ncbi:hypothetical protein HRbin15_00559 [bacterium HR15]|nr:hypothetical protein HRbin15_00559 [bacterium HR15]
MRRCTKLMVTVSALGIALLVATPIRVMGQPPGLGESESMSDEEPILTIPEDICDIAIEPMAVDLLLNDPIDFYAIYMVPVPCEPPPAEYKCQGCRDKGGTVYECYADPVPDEVIRQMRETDQLLLTTGYTVELHCDREDVPFREARQRYRVLATCREGQAAIHESQFSHPTHPSYRFLKNYLTNTTPQIIVDGKPWIPYPEGSPLPFMRPIERVYYEHKKRKLFVQAMRLETIWVASNDRISHTDPASSNLSVLIERSRRWCEAATWFDRSMCALGRFVSSELGKGLSASWLQDGRILLVADHHLYPEWEWHLVVDPRLRYLTVQAELVERKTKKILQRWQNSGVMQGEIPLAQQAVWTEEASQSSAQLVVECRSYELCFDKNLHEEIFQRIKKAKSFRDMRVEPFVDIQVK